MVNNTSQVCVFCRSTGPFTTVEHIVPASLGNDEDVLEGAVCDDCQNYLSHSVEKPALEKTPLAFWRVYLGIKNRKGSLPSVNLSPPDGGRIPASHSLTDNIGFTAHLDGSVSLDTNCDELVQDILAGKKDQLRLVLSPWHLSILGRFLGKMGLEFLAKSNHGKALAPALDEFRHYVRYGAVHQIWPVYWGQYVSLSELRRPCFVHEDCILEEVECYRYSLRETSLCEIVFAFSIGADLLEICLSHRLPLPHLAKLVEGRELSCLWYPDKSW